MDRSDTPVAVRHNGWTAARKTAFLEHLAACGSVRAASSRAGMSHEAAAYRLKRRDALFARGSAAALALTREASADVIACRQGERGQDSVNSVNFASCPTACAGAA